MNVLNYVKLCKAVEEPIEEIKDYYDKDIDDIQEYRFNGNKVYCITSNDITTIVIRGTKNKKTYLSDINYGLSYDSLLDISVHRGFKKVCDNLMEIVLPDIKIKAFNIVGHSLGGGVAILLGLRLVELGYNVIDVITFGQPKITNKDGYKNIQKYLKKINFIRVVNDNDIVPTMPGFLFSQLFKGQYVHFGYELHILENGDTNVTTKVKHNRFMYLKMWLSAPMHPIESITDHLIGNYLDIVNKSIIK